MKKSLLSLLLSLLLVITVCSGVSCAAEEEKELTPVTLNEVAHSIFYAPQYVAIELGYFEESGIDLTLVTGFGVIHKVQNACL